MVHAHSSKGKSANIAFPLMEDLSLAHFAVMKAVVDYFVSLIKAS